MANHRTKVLCGAAVLAMGFICITYSKRAHPVKPEYAKDLSIHMALDAADKINNHLKLAGFIRKSGGWGLGERQSSQKLMISPAAWNNISDESIMLIVKDGKIMTRSRNALPSKMQQELEVLPIIQAIAKGSSIGSVYFQMSDGTDMVGVHAPISAINGMLLIVRPST